MSDEEGSAKVMAPTVDESFNHCKGNGVRPLNAADRKGLGALLGLLGQLLFHAPSRDHENRPEPAGQVGSQQVRRIRIQQKQRRMGLKRVG